MNIIGISAALFPDIIIITFELMTNHLHATVAGEEHRVKSFFETVRRFISGSLKIDLHEWSCRLRDLDTLEDVRAVIAYNNRNGFLVNENETPFSYPWGANRYFFNPEAIARYKESSKPLTFRERRKSTASHSGDQVKCLRKVDDYASPLSYCSIQTGESLFRNAAHYFYEISKNIESQRKIAAEIGERVFYTDNELFRALQSICKDKYGINRSSQLPAEAKIEVARTLHFGYNAGNKQIQRMLGLDINTLDSLFPSSGK